MQIRKSILIILIIQLLSGCSRFNNVTVSNLEFSDERLMINSFAITLTFDLYDHPVQPVHYEDEAE